MKRNNCIENIQQEISKKITAQTQSEKDFIVFRPKSQLAHSFLTKQFNPMTSIFQLESKRRNQNLLLKFRCKTKEAQEISFEVDDHLQIQRCKTFKKFKLHKALQLTALQPFKVRTSQTRRQKTSQQRAEIYSSFKIGSSNPIQQKYRNSCLVVRQKKKYKDPLQLNQNPNTLTLKEKQNFSSSININRLRPSLQLQEAKEIFPLHLFHEKPFDNYHVKSKMRRSRDTQKRLQTQLSNNNIQKFVFLKHKKPFEWKVCQNHTCLQEKIADESEKFGFNPWQTMEILDKEEDLEELQNSS